MFEHLTARADRLADETGRLRRERNAHARQSFEILRSRAGSPLGLTLCFGAGVFAGARSRREDRSGSEGASRRRPERPDAGLTERVLQGPVGAAALRLGTMFVAGALMHPDREPPPSP